MLIIYYKKVESKNELKEIDIRNRTCYYFDGIIRIKYFDLDNILIDEKLYENILFYSISYKSLIDSNPSIKPMDLLEIMMELDIPYFFEVKNMISFTTGLHIL